MSPWTLDAAHLARAAAVFSGFVVALFVGSIVLPGSMHDGALLKDGTRQRYKLNGLLLFLTMAAVLAVGTWQHWLSLTFVYENYGALLVVANVFAFSLTAILYLRGRRAAARAGKPLSSSPLHVINDAFMGTELNPMFFGVDLKMFAYRPSLMGLGVLVWSFAAVQYEALGHLTGRMWLFQAFYFVYLFNYFQFEYGMLFTWDIIAENFGWMLVWGDYVLVPFFYSIAGWILVGNTAPLPGWEAALLIVMYGFGFWVFRGANEQKHQYKSNPQTRIWGKPAEAIGGRLLVSGFWGIGRKINYSGELTMYTAWSILAGFSSIIPFLLPLWLLALFTHRAWRDEQRCAAKYGETWTAYCQKATFRMFPFIY